MAVKVHDMTQCCSCDYHKKWKGFNPRYLTWDLSFYTSVMDHYQFTICFVIEKYIFQTSFKSSGKCLNVEEPISERNRTVASKQASKKQVLKNVSLEGRKISQIKFRAL